MTNLSKPLGGGGPLSPIPGSPAPYTGGNKVNGTDFDQIKVENPMPSLVHATKNRPKRPKTHMGRGAVAHVSIFHTILLQ